MTQVFAPVAPLSAHRQLESRGALGNYNLLIASEILKDHEGYEEFWQGRRNDASCLIMDNGVIETGAPLPIPLLAKAASIVGAQVLVLPDTIDDSKMTIKQVRTTMALLSTRQARSSMPGGLAYLGVVQGTTFAECMDCADAHVQAGVSWLAIPRGLTPNIGSRFGLVEAIAEEHPEIKLHLLGFSENLHDDIYSAVASRAVVGIDAATPVWLGLLGKRLSPSMTHAGEPPRNANFGRRPEWFWQTGPQTEFYADQIAANVLTVRRWLYDASGNLARSAATAARTGKAELSDQPAQ